MYVTVGVNMHLDGDGEIGMLEAELLSAGSELRLYKEREEVKPCRKRKGPETERAH